MLTPTDVTAYLNTLSPIAAKMGVISKTLFSWEVRKTITDGILDIFIGFVLLSIPIGIFLGVKNKLKDINWGFYIDEIVVYVIVFLILESVGFSFFYNGTENIFSPQAVTFENMVSTLNPPGKKD